MVLRLHQIGGSLPFSMPCDPSGEFQPGMIGQIYLSGNQIVVGVSDGSAPFGVIDDMRTSAFTRASVDEMIQVESDQLLGPVYNDGYGSLRTTVPIKIELLHPNVVPTSFISDRVDVALKATNGVVTFPIGTALNFDSDGDGVPDSIRTICNYAYQVANTPGDDSTYASGMVTVWFGRMIFETDQFDTSARYPVSAPLFVNESGLLTTRQINGNYPAVAMCMAPPNSLVSSIQVLWY
jgi:hypothetical protein